MNLGKRITELRIEKKYTTNKLANLAGISQSYLRDIELGNKNPTVEVMSYICDALDITLHEFFLDELQEVNPFLLSAIKMLTAEQQIKLADYILSMKK